MREVLCTVHKSLFFAPRETLRAEPVGNELVQLVWGAVFHAEKFSHIRRREFLTEFIEDELTGTVDGAFGH